MTRPFVRWSRVSACIAVDVGVRPEIWTIEVPSLIFVVWAPIQVSGVNASEPQASAVQTEWKPRRSAVWAISTKFGWGCAPQ